MTCNVYFKSSSPPSLGGDGWQRSYPVNTYLGANDRAAKAFARLHGELFAAATT